MAIMQLTVIPLGTTTPSVGDHVAAIQQLLRDEAIDCQLTDMGTVIEGEVEFLLALAGRLHGLPFVGGVQRVVTQIVLDERRDKEVHLGDKAASVRDRLS